MANRSMDSKEAEFLKRILATFQAEAREHVRALSVGLIQLEKTSESRAAVDLVETLFREAHSLKGAARSVDQRKIESVCQALESALAVLQRQPAPLSSAQADLLHQAVDYIARLLSSPAGKPTAADQALQHELPRNLRDAFKDSDASLDPGTGEPEGGIPGPEVLEERAPGPAPPPAPLPEESVRIPSAKLDRLLMQAEEMILLKMIAGRRADDLRAVQQGLAALETGMGWGTGPRAAAGAPAEIQAHFSALQRQVRELCVDLARELSTIGQMVDEHLEAMKEILMLPVASMVDVFPKLVRDLARDQGKEVELVIHGKEMEIDKRVLEELKEPLIHLIRNGIDHGLAQPADRAARNQPRKGTITLTFAAKDGRQVEITISDDGAGIDLERVRAAATSKGLVSAQEAADLNFQRTSELVFLSGLSTSPIITDISGRGLGLAIVREKVERLGGSVSVVTSPQQGTTFRLLLPITLATFRGVLVRVEDHLFLLPTAKVLGARRVGPEEIKTVKNQPTINLDGEVISLVGLGDCLGLFARGAGSRPQAGSSASATEANKSTILVVDSADRRVAFQVDEVMGEQQVLLKKLGRQLSRVRNITGAALMGGGRVVPVLDIPDLMVSAVRSGGRAASPADPRPLKTGRVLVAEDSITARTLIKNILQTAGYQVATAVDGMDALAQAQSGEFDLLVTDVDMPRMSGFELTTKIRENRKLGRLPVVLVTALESLEDRKHGIDVGADAYIVKSSFDQSNLLAVIRQLI